MPEATKVLERTFEALFPHLTPQARARLASELVRIIDTSAEKGWDLAAITLIARGARQSQIGTTLQRLRIRAGLTQEEVTRRSVQHTRGAAWHVAKVTRIETGAVPIAFADLQFLLHLYGVRDQATVDGLWALARASHPPRRTARKAS